MRSDEKILKDGVSSTQSKMLEVLLDIRKFMRRERPPSNWVDVGYECPGCGDLDMLAE